MMNEKVDATEKITININTVDLGYIDVLVSEGYYATRTEFIKTAIKRQLEGHHRELERLIERKEQRHTWTVVGIGGLTESDLLKAKTAGQKLRIAVVGLLIIPEDIPMELIEETVESIHVYGVSRCSREIKARYGL